MQTSPAVSNEHVSLWKRIEAFSLDDPSAKLTFTRRLARENGWSLGYAVRVVDEYKRFMFLTIAAEHTATPSEDVDQAWHLHLAYTRSYWNDFCGEVLRCPIHHGPTRGGDQEQQRHDEQYEQTLATYARHFGAEPPADIWPATDKRFGEDLMWQRVNLRRHWVIPKLRWAKRSARDSDRTANASRPVAGAAVAAVMVPMVSLGMWNPLDFVGTLFLMFFALVASLAVAAGVVLRWVMLSRTDDSTCQLGELDALQLALLNDRGRTRYAQAGLAALASQGAATVGEDHNKLLGLVTLSTTNTYHVDAKPPEGASPSLVRLHRRLAALGSSSLDEAAKEALEVAKDEEHDLQQRKLLMGSWASSAALWVSLAPIVLVLLLGIAKIMIGVGREKPVAFLVIGCIALAAVSLIGLGRKPRRTKSGDRLLEEAVAEHGDLKSATPDMETGGSPEMVALAVGLFGTSYLVGSGLDVLHTAWPKSASGGWTGGCGGDSGGCGGDGGGCGGGGCGGCGGD